MAVTGFPDRTWWTGKPLRLIQTNLPEIDIGLDSHEYVEALLDYNAEVVIINTGGIVANYKSTVEGHFHNPFLNPGKLEEIITRLHDAGIRVVGRFDFSKINREVYYSHPDWAYRTERGRIVDYCGQVHGCINTGYQRERAPLILDEAIRNLHLDGVFFNMPGYITSDYSGNEYGMCHCDGCCNEFKRRTGLDLGQVTSASEEFRLYENFKKETAVDLFLAWRTCIKNASPACAIMNYDPDGVDVLRDEANTDLKRQGPEDDYAGSRQTRRILSSWPGVASSNSAVHFIDFPMRQSGISPWLTARRLAQSMLNGGWLDYYIIGHLSNQDDRGVLPLVKDIYRFHVANDIHFSEMQPIASVCIVEPDKRRAGAQIDEFLGWYRALSEAHVMTDVLHERAFEAADMERRLKSYECLILPGVDFQDAGAWGVVNAWHRAGGRLILSAGAIRSVVTSSIDRMSVGIETVEPGISFPPATGFDVDEEAKEYLGAFEDLDYLYLDGSYFPCKYRSEASVLLPRYVSFTFGPPEKCYKGEIGGEPGLIVGPDGRSYTIPWGVGAHYQRHAHRGHAQLMQSVVRNLSRPPVRLETDAHPCIELSVHANSRGEILVSAVNLSGQLGTAFHRPIPVSEFRINLHNDFGFDVASATALRSGTTVPVTAEKEGMSFMFPAFELFETVCIELQRRTGSSV